MIRIGLPVPTVLQLRLRAQLTATRTHRQADMLRRAVVDSFHDDMASLRAWWDAGPLARRARAARQRRAAALVPDFSVRYQELVDLLCWSAKEGVHEGQQERYADLRSWFVRHYPVVRPVLLPHLLREDDGTPASAGRRRAPRDAFETLFAASDVDAVINSESVIPRIYRTRAALDACLDEMAR